MTYFYIAIGLPLGALTGLLLSFAWPSAPVALAIVGPTILALVRHVELWRAFQREQAAEPDGDAARAAWSEARGASSDLLRVARITAAVVAIVLVVRWVIR